MGKGYNAFGQFWQIRSGDPAFCFFAAHVDLDQDTELLTSSLLRLCAVQALGQRPVVDRIDGVEGPRGASGLVALQVADEVPGSLEIRHRGELAFPFLNSVLPKVA